MKYEDVLFWMFQVIWSIYLAWWIYYSVINYSPAMVGVFCAIFALDIYLTMNMKGML